MTWNPHDNAVTGQTVKNQIANLGEGQLVYKPDPWLNYQFRKSLDRVPELVESALKGAKKVETFGVWTKECKGLLKSGDMPKLENVHPSDAWAEKLHQQAKDLPEFQDLERVCRGSDEWSSLGAATIGSAVEKLLPKADKDGPKKDVKKMEQLLDQLQSLADKTGDQEVQIIADKQEQATEKAAQAAEQMAQELEEHKVRQAMRGAIAEALDKINDAERALTAMGCGKGPGTGGTPASTEAKLKLAQMMASNEKFKRIARMAGRQMSICSEKRATRSDMARSEMYGIHKSDDVEHLITEEAIFLIEPKLRLFFAEKFAEKRLLTHRLRGKENLSKGPVVFAVDNSGSMNGFPEELSKAIALAAMQQCRTDKRAFALLHFNNAVRFTLRHSPKNPASMDKIIEAIEFFSSGGTDYVDVLTQACQVVAQESSILGNEMKKADIVLITDGVCNFSPELEAMVKNSNSEFGTQLITILIGAYPSNEDLKSTEGFFGATQRLGKLVVVDDIYDHDQMLDSIYLGI